MIFTNKGSVDEFYPGQSVIYIPNHAFGDAAHPDCESGVVTSVGGTGIVFVRYGADVNSKATSAHNLLAAYRQPA